MGLLCLVNLNVCTLEKGWERGRLANWTAGHALSLVQGPRSTQCRGPHSSPALAVLGIWTTHLHLGPIGVGCSREVDDFLDLIAGPV